LTWTIEYDVAAVKGLKNVGKLGYYWRYRVGDYRLICSIEDNKVTILVVLIGHRGNVYKKG